MKDFRQIKAIEKANKERLVKHFGAITNESGIYFLTRVEGGFKYAYVGQAKHILERLAQHLSGYQHIDSSLKKRGFYSKESNPYGWDLLCFRCPLEELNAREQEFIKEYANSGFQMLNKTAGGQSNGKFEIAETKPRKTYREGLAQGYANAQRDIAKLFDKNLVVSINGKENKNKLNALQKFKDFIGGNDGREKNVCENDN